MSDDTWTVRELPILRAIRNAEEAQDDIGACARRAAQNLDERLYNETINSLTQAGFVDAEILPYGGGKLLVHVRRLLPKGREAVGQWPAAPLGGAVARRKASRLVFMDMLYDEVGDNTLATAEVAELSAKAGIRTEESGPLVEYLSAHGLIQTYMDDQVSITHEGIIEVEFTRTKPDEATTNFPSQTAVYIGGDAHGVQIAIGSAEASQNMQHNESQDAAIAEFVTEFRRVFDDLDIPSATLDGVEATLAAAEAMVASSEPDHTVLRVTVAALRDIALGVTGNAAFAGLVALAMHLR